MQLPAGVHVAVRGWLSANQIFLRSAKVLDVVDSGFSLHSQQTIDLVQHELDKQAGCRVGKLLNTHLHSDHCGGNHALQDHFGFEIWIPEASWDIVNNWDEEKLSYKQLGQPCPRYKPQHALISGEKISLGGRDWLILAAPGHDHHSIMLYQNELGILISADALWENGFGAVIHELYDDGGFSEIKDTLDLISTLDISLVIPGHGTPFTNIKDALSRAYSRLDYLASSPEKNALHVAKVICSYKLMELQKVPRKDFEWWFLKTPIMNQIANKELQISTSELFEKTLQSLALGQIITDQDGWLTNLG